MFALASSHVSRSFLTCPLKGQKNTSIDLALDQQILLLYFTHLCSMKNTWWTPGNQQGSMIWTSQNPDGCMSIRIQESNGEDTNQQLPATKRALADPTRAALLCKQLPGPGHQWGEAAHTGGRTRNLSPISSGSWGKEENHHRLLLSDALCFLAEEAHRDNRAQRWALLGPAATTSAGPNTLLQPPAPKLICTLMNIPSAVHFFWNSEPLSPLRLSTLLSLLRELWKHTVNWSLSFKYESAVI